VFLAGILAAFASQFLVTAKQKAILPETQSSGRELIGQPVYSDNTRRTLIISLATVTVLALLGYLAHCVDLVGMHTRRNINEN